MDPITTIALPTLRGKLTYEEAVEKEHDVLQRLTYWQKKEDFVAYLAQHTQDIEDLVAYYLRLKDPEKSCLAPQESWIHGSFNICLPVSIINWKKRPGGHVMVRFPLPFKVGEAKYPGNADEKLRCEVATYAWIRENCPSVPIPYLWGFAFADCAKNSFYTLDSAPLLVQLFETLRRKMLSLLGRSIPCRYMSTSRPYNLKVGHLVIDYIEKSEATMLSTTWESLRHDKFHRTNLFRGLSRIMLELGKIPCARIGSFTMDNRGVISLTNRPLTLQVHQLENEGIPTGIDRHTTYTSTDSYLFDVLGCHDSRLRHQPNAVESDIDCRAQMSMLSLFRLALPHFMQNDQRHGPFFLTLNDVHQSNIFVDEEWNIKSIIDLEWACTLPIEMRHPPYWLTSQAVDCLDEEELDKYGEMHQEFSDDFAQEELLFHPGSSEHLALLPYASDMKRGLKDGSFFYFMGLDSLSGLFNICLQHIQPRFDRYSDEFVFSVSPYWQLDSKSFVANKIEHRRQYDASLKEKFEDRAGISSES